MAEFSDFIENAIINHFLKNSTSGYTPVATVYLALFTANTGLESDSPSAECKTPGVDNYARVAITWGTASGGAVSNSAAVEFAAAGGTGWGTITHAAIVDHATNVTWGTNVHVIMWTDITSKTIAANDIFRVPIGDLDVTVS